MATQDQLASKISVASKNIVKQVSTLAGVLTTEVEAKTAKLEDLDYQLEAKQLQLANLKKEYDLKAKDAKLNFEVTIRESKEKALKEALGADFVIVPTSTIDEHAEFEKQVEDMIASAVKKANTSNAISKAAEIRSLELEHKGKSLEMESKGKAAEFELETLKGQITDLKEQLKANREAQVKMAEASAITVNTSGK